MNDSRAIFRIDHNGDTITRTTTLLEAQHLVDERYPDATIIDEDQDREATGVIEPHLEGDPEAINYEQKQGEWCVCNHLLQHNRFDPPIDINHWVLTSEGREPTPSDIEITCRDGSTIGVELTSLVRQESLQRDIQSSHPVASPASGVDSLDLLRERLDDKRSKVPQYRAHVDRVWLLLHPIPAIELVSTGAVSSEQGRRLHEGDARTHVEAEQFKRVYYSNPLLGHAFLIGST